MWPSQNIWTLTDQGNFRSWREFSKNSAKPRYIAFLLEIILLFPTRILKNDISQLNHSIIPFTHTRHALLTADLQRAPGAEKRYYQTHQSKEITHFELMTNWNIFFRSHSLLSLRGHSITMWTRKSIGVWSEESPSLVTSTKGSY